MRGPLLWIILCAAAGCSVASHPSPPNAATPALEPPDVPPVVAAAKGEANGTATPVSRSASNASAADLRKAADDPRADRSARAAAVFALFANYLKPRCGTRTAGEALGDAKWLTDANPSRVIGVGG